MQGTAPVIRATWVSSGDVSQNRRHGDVHGVMWKCITKLALCNRSCGVGIQKRECSEIGKGEKKGVHVVETLLARQPKKTQAPSKPAGQARSYQKYFTE